MKTTPPKRKPKTFVIPQQRTKQRKQPAAPPIPPLENNHGHSATLANQPVIHNTSTPKTGNRQPRNQHVIHRTHTTTGRRHQHVIDIPDDDLDPTKLALDHLQIAQAITNTATYIAQQIQAIDLILNAIAKTLRFAQPPHNGKIDIRYWKTRGGGHREPVIVRWITNPYGPNKGQVLTPKPIQRVRKITRSVAPDQLLEVIQIAQDLIQKRKQFMQTITHFNANFSRSKKRHDTAPLDKHIEPLRNLVRSIITAASHSGISIAEDDFTPIKEALFDPKKDPDE